MSKTHFADDMTLAHIAKLEAENAALRAELLELHDVVPSLRAALTVITDRYETLLSDGFPARGRSADDKDSRLGWQDDNFSAIKCARDALNSSKEWGSIIDAAIDRARKP